MGSHSINVREVGRVIIASCAPDESELFDYFADRYFASVESPPSPALVPADREAGSGLEVATLVLTYVVLPVLTSVLSAVAEGAREAIKEVSKEQVKAILKPHAAKLLALHRQQVGKLPQDVLADPEAQAKLSSLNEFLKTLEEK